MTGINISFDTFLVTFLMGGSISLIYLVLLWYSLKLLPRIKKKGLFLFISAALRIFLFLFLAVWLSQNDTGRFLGIVIGFICVRLMLLSKIRNGRKK